MNPPRAEAHRFHINRPVSLDRLRTVSNPFPTVSVYTLPGSPCGISGILEPLRRPLRKDRLILRASFLKSSTVRVAGTSLFHRPRDRRSLQIPSWWVEISTVVRARPPPPAQAQHLMVLPPGQSAASSSRIRRPAGSTGLARAARFIGRMNHRFGKLKPLQQLLFRFQSQWRYRREHN